MMVEHEQVSYHHDIVKIAVDNDDEQQNIIEGNLTLPSTTIDTKGTVIFAHGSGSSRHSSRNQYVAQVLNKAGIATLLIDLLTNEEENIDDMTKEYRFNIRLLARRLLISTDWLSQYPKLRNLNIGYFGASTGAAASISCSFRTDKCYQCSCITWGQTRSGRSRSSKSHSISNTFNCRRK